MGLDHSGSQPFINVLLYVLGIALTWPFERSLDDDNCVHFGVVCGTLENREMDRTVKCKCDSML